MKTDGLRQLSLEQEKRNTALLESTPLLSADRVESRVLPFRLDPAAGGALTAADDAAIAALEKTAAAIAIKSVASLARVNDIDHLGGGLDLIPGLMMTLGIVDYDARHFTIEHGHTSIGYYASLAALGFLDEERVISGFRRSLDIAGHVSWLPGGTQLSSGRLGVILPVAAGQALGLKARHGADALVVMHTGDAGWISGQALNGFIAASLHEAPVMYVMHRNGVQLSAPTSRVMNKDPRGVAASLGVQVLEIPSLHDRPALFKAYGEAMRLAKVGKPSLVYPTGFGSTDAGAVTLTTFGEKYGVASDVAHFAAEHKVALDTKVWIPGALMSFRDVHSMIECLFYVNGLAGGEGHHDGGMKGRDEQKVLQHPILQLTSDETNALAALRSAAPRIVVTHARPAKGMPNLLLTKDDVAGIELPAPGKAVSARAGSEAAYVAVVKKHKNSVFVVSCDLDPSTKLGKAAAMLPGGHHFEMSIQEQAAALMNDGLSMSSREPQLNVFSTFAAFIEGIAREGFEFWRYQRNLTGRNEGLNVLMHLAHVGACTGRDHFSGWSFDWVNLGLGYMPFLRRFYAPADARAAFLAVKDAASAFGGHIVAVPRDVLPILTKPGSKDPLWAATDEWTPVTQASKAEGAKVAILALGAPAFVAVQAAEQAAAKGASADVYVVNGFPLPDAFLGDIASKYRGVITIEDGLIGTEDTGLRGFAGLVATTVRGTGPATEHFGITDPTVAPSEEFAAVWKHFGMTADALAEAVIRVGSSK
jgi:transketolase N-terminal domain/subunit/transketolase C-terminal domain/subunit